MAQCAPRSSMAFIVFFGLLMLAGCGSPGTSVCNLSALNGSCGCGPASQGAASACVAPQYIYANGISGQVSVFPVDPGSGELQSPLSVSGPTESLGMTVLNNQFLYVSDLGVGASPSIDAWSINFGTGALTSISPVSLGPLSVAAGLASDPFTQVVYVADAGKIDALKADSTGALTPIGGSPFTAGTNLFLTLDPQARFLFASDYDPPGGVEAFTINASTGALTAVAGSPFPAVPGSSTNTHPAEIVVDPTGQFVYVALTATNQVAGFSIAADGSLSAVPGSPFGAGTTPLALATANEFLYVAGGGGDLFGYQIDPATGSLSAVPGSPFPVSTGAMVSNITGSFLYAATSGGIVTLKVDSSTGSLSQVGAAAPSSGASVLAFVQ